LYNKLTGVYNRDEKCLLRSTDWEFKSNRLHFVFNAFNGKKSSEDKFPKNHKNYVCEKISTLRRDQTKAKKSLVSCGMNEEIPEFCILII